MGGVWGIWGLGDRESEIEVRRSEIEGSGEGHEKGLKRRGRIGLGRTGSNQVGCDEGVGDRRSEFGDRGARGRCGGWGAVGGVCRGRGRGKGRKGGGGEREILEGNSDKFGYFRVYSGRQAGVGRIRGWQVGRASAKRAGDARPPPRLPHPPGAQATPQTPRPRAAGTHKKTAAPWGAAVEIDRSAIRPAIRTRSRP